MRPLGPLQIAHLQMFQAFGSWNSWSGGWRHAADVRCIKSLVKRGLLTECRQGTYRQYSINAAGIKALEQNA